MHRKRTVTLLLIAFVFFLVSWKLPAMNQSLRVASQSLFEPALSIISVARIQSQRIRNHFFDFIVAVDKHRENLKKIDTLESQLLDYKEMKRENERLRDLLQFKKVLPLQAVVAQIIGYDLTPWRKTITIDKGSADGLPDKAVLSAPAGLVGRVTEMGLFSARALLITDPVSRVSVLTDSTRTQGVVFGDGSSMLSMRYIHIDDPIRVGEDVMTSGMGGIFKKGIRVGKIVSIDKDHDGMHLSAVVEPSVQFSRLEEVLCYIS